MRRIVRAFIALALGIVFVSCVGGPAPNPELKHPVGKSIEGTYSVGFADELIGELSLDNGRYSFTPKQGVSIPLDAKDRLSFVKDSRGYYRVKYYDSVDQDVPLENLEHLAILSYIEFGLEQTGPLSGSIFLIRNDSEEKILYFHAVGSELETWRVTKPWD